MSKNKWEDSYEVNFTTYEDLMAEIKEMEAHARWLPGMPSKDIRVQPIEAPMFVKPVADRTGIDLEMCEYTATEGSKLYVELPDGTAKLLDKSGIGSLESRACIFGSALGRLNPCSLADVLNLCLNVSPSEALVYELYGKVAALHSDAAGGYCVMPISTLFSNTVKAVSARCGKMEFLDGYNSHTYTTGMWKLPEIQEKLTDKYHEAMLKARRTDHFGVRNAMPVVRLSTSNTATSSAILRPMFKVKNWYFQLSEDIAVKHSRHTVGKEGVALFAEEVDNKLYARLNDAVEAAAQMMNIVLANPENVVISLCNKFRIPKKYGNPALEKVMTFTMNGGVVSAYDVYLALSEAIAEGGPTAAFEIGERLCAAMNPKFDWASCDVYGTVAWAA